MKRFLIALMFVCLTLSLVSASYNQPIDDLTASRKVWVTGVPEVGNNKQIKDYNFSEGVATYETNDPAGSEADTSSIYGLKFTDVIGGEVYDSDYTSGTAYMNTQTGWDLTGLDLDTPSGTEWGFDFDSLGDYYKSSVFGGAFTLYSPTTALRTLGLASVYIPSIDDYQDQERWLVEMSSYSTLNSVNVLFFLGYKPYGEARQGWYYLTSTEGGTVPDKIEIT